jgi:hypothetical protein
MDAIGILLIVALVAGPASIAGGIVLYRGSSRAGRRAVGIAAAAGGVGLLVLTAIVVPVSWDGGSSQSGVTVGVGAPPLPVIRLQHRDKTYEGAQASYCWPEDPAGESSLVVCADAIAWAGIDSTVPVSRGDDVLVKVESNGPPNELVAQVFADPAGPMIQSLDLEPASTATLPLDLGPGSYLLRVSGRWPDGQADYEFRFVLVPGGDGLAAECFHTEAEPLPLTYDVLNEPTPSGFDGMNSAGCRFSKPVSRVSVFLSNDNGSRHGETFFIEPPSVELSFPLPDGLMSEKTLELLAPGEYRRQMVAVAEDGDTWDVTANLQAALDTVTVVGDTRD